MHNSRNVFTSTNSSTSYGIVNFPSNFTVRQLGFGVGLLFLYHTLHLTETLSLAVGMVAAGYFSLFSFFSHFNAMALGEKKIASASRLYRGFPTIARRLMCALW